MRVKIGETMDKKMPRSRLRPGPWMNVALLTRKDEFGRHLSDAIVIDTLDQRPRARGHRAFRLLYTLHNLAPFHMAKIACTQPVKTKTLDGGFGQHQRLVIRRPRHYPRGVSVRGCISYISEIIASGISSRSFVTASLLVSASIYFLSGMTVFCV